ncbi:hypothetical protein [Microbulbifer marinus]|uniref:hypothetical protein n=1 Tax=Microbulbifer marinus TaxID=658218 RepID=UPI0011152D8C|nr:hypothetical protein [Microbulbifer marinus]
MKNLFDQFSHSRRARRLIGLLGLLLVAPVALWLPLGWMGLAPSMVEVFGIEGLRIPASIAIFGLLVAAIGFWDYDAD